MDKLGSVSELAKEIGIASRNNDLERLAKLEGYFRESDEPSSLPFAPNVSLNYDFIDAVQGHVESDAVLGLANALSRAKRRVLYNKEKWLNFRRPVIVSEGDSWFQYPFKLDDVIDVLMDDYLVLSLGAGGDLLSDMLEAGEYLKAIEQEQADIFLISGGGNDFLHSGRLKNYLRDYEEGMDVNSLINQTTWDEFLTDLKQSYAKIFDSVVTTFPGVKIYCHGYDYVLPRSNGIWLGKPLQVRNVPESLWSGVVKVLIDQLNEMLIHLSAMYSGKVTHIDCRERVGETKSSWFDELHPKDAGYKRVAELFKQEIQTYSETSQRFETMAESSRQTTTDLKAAQPSVLTPTSKLPKNVAAQFIANLRDISQPSSLAVIDEAEDGVLQEAIIDSGRMKVGPLLVSAPTARHKQYLDLTTPYPSPINTCSIARSVAKAVLSEGRMPSYFASSMVSPRATESASDADLLKKAPCSSLDAWQAHLRNDKESVQSYNDYVDVRNDYENTEHQNRINTRLELFPENDIFFEERVIGRSNLEQVNFLSRGVLAARTVGRLSIFTEYGVPAGTGSGFLVGEGLLLTNNHVLSNVEGARSGSYILFEYEYDEKNKLKTSERFELNDNIFLTDKDLDFTFVSLEKTGNKGSSIEAYGHLRLIKESGKALKGEAVSIIQHPQGLPKQIAIRESTVVGVKDAFIYYYADTNRGSSGSPVLNDQWFPVALHHRSVPNYFEPCQYVANRGVRVSEIFNKAERMADAGSEIAKKVLKVIQTAPVLSSPKSIQASQDTGAQDEKFVEPFHELPYDNRSGYDEEFLGVKVRMPMVKQPESIAAPLIDKSRNKYLVDYEHFSVVMHRLRRLAIFTAANTDASPKRKQPDANKKYSRGALAGLQKNDIERWFPDPRISQEHQLPDRFFHKDGQAFDKGHLTMRSEVAWGNDYAEVRRANGDTYHTTNCSPQVAEFNRSIFGFHGLWGELEEIVLKAAKQERLCVFAGPVLSDSDPTFRGKDNEGEALIQIPEAYWKVVVARTEKGLASFAYILEQDLSDVPLEFDAPAVWQSHQVSISELEDRLEILSFPAEIRNSDMKLST